MRIIKKYSFNFYEQHELNEKRTKRLKILLPLVLLIVVGILYYCAVKWIQIYDEYKTWLMAAQTSNGAWILFWATVVYFIWWSIAYGMMLSTLQSPIDKMMMDNSASEVTPGMIKHNKMLHEFSDVVGELSVAYGMPKPKLYIVYGTIEPNAFAVESLDKDGNVNLAVGKCSFEPAKLEENVNAVVNQILKVRPASVKGVYVKSCHLATTMGPSVKLAVGD